MTKNIGIRTLAIAFCMLAMNYVYGQASVLGHSGVPTDHLGWDVNTTFPLEIRHDAGDQRIEFYTTGDGISEMWLTPTLQNFVFNGYTTLDLSCNLGVGPGFSDAIPPMSRLHVNAQPMLNVGSYTRGYRDWMRAGLLCTEGRDGMYVGLKNEGSETQNPAVINWSSNALAIDPLRFIFTYNLNLRRVS